MDDIDIRQIKASLLEEQRLETKLKKQPETSDELLPLLHRLYIARMNLERANWGCSVDRNRFSLLKSSLLEEAHLEELLKQGSNNNGTHEGPSLGDVITPAPLKHETTQDLDTDLEKLLDIAKNKSTIYISELEANLDPTVACPLLPTGETPGTIATAIKRKTDNYLKDKTVINTAPEKAAEATEPQTTKQDALKEKEKRRQLVRYIMSSTK